jgi:cytochrome c oxidase assembly protein subunit 15
MGIRSAPGHRPTITPRAYRAITLATLASLVFIMVTGAAVRLTGSGLGCSTWPACESDSFFARTGDTPGMIEDGNRLVTGLVGLFTIAAVLGAHWRSPRREDLFRWALGLPVWVLANALVGALVVVLDLSPVSVIAHFLLSLGALWNALVLHHKAGETPSPDGRRRELALPVVRRACDLLLVAAGLALVTGTIVTGSGPHAGIAVILFGSLTLIVWWMARSGDAAPSVEARVRLLFLVLAAQAAVGYTQYFTGVPAWLVGIHVLGAASVWLAVVWLRLGLSEPLISPVTSPSAAAEPAATPGVVIGG